MKITAKSARRSPSKNHEVADSPISKLKIFNGNVCFSVMSDEDPGISSGHYNLEISLSDSEVWKLFKTCISSDAFNAIAKLEKENQDLKLKNLVRTLQGQKGSK
ncbi:MAG: hypothetical protein WBD01_00160 [Salaquimonas sp.]